MKKVIFVTPNLSNGGAERVTVMLANELAKDNIGVTLVYMKDDITSYRPEMNVKVCYFFTKGNRIKRLISKIVRLRKLMKKHKDATYVAMLPYETLYTYIAAFGLRQKVVYSLRNDPSNMKGWLWWVIKNIIYPKAGCIVFQTEAARDYFPEKIQKKSVVIPNPISENLPERYLGERRKEIVTVGRLTSQKNYPLMLSAFANVHSIYPDWKLRIFGQGTLENELKALCKEKKIEDFVEFCGFQSNVIEEINQSGIFVLSSDYEGISNAMLEALATGIPCVCTDCPAGGARMIIQDHKNGILVPIRDEKKLTEAIIELIENPDLAERLSRNAIKIGESLSTQRIAEMWSSVI